MARAIVVVVVLAVVIWIVSIVDCAVQPPSRHRGVSKGAWVAIVVLLPVIGGILWFVLGRMRPRTAASGPIAPDDNPEFLSTLSTSAAEQDERIRQLEEELARLDAEEPDASAPPAAQPPVVPPPSTDDDDSRDQHGARS